MDMKNSETRSIKNRKYHTVTKIPKSDRKTVVTCTFVTPSTYNWPLTSVTLFNHFKTNWLGYTSLLGAEPWEIANKLLLEKRKFKKQ